jgi:hypothetical protein
VTDVSRGDRVEFEDEIYGKKTGKVLGVLHFADVPTAAVIELDGSLAGMAWSVPIDEVKLLKAAA